MIERENKIASLWNEFTSWLILFILQYGIYNNYKSEVYNIVI